MKPTAEATRRIVRAILDRGRELGLTATELGRRAGVSRTTLWRLKQGQGGRLHVILTLAHEVGYDLVLGRKGGP